jgi:3-isopropylmalate/(R)-2-methylmalate dehydratase large subunit
MASTLYDKLWQSHVVHDYDDGSSIIYIDRQLLHEVTSPQAFESIGLSRRNLWRTTANVAVPDHNVPTKDRHKPIPDPISKLQVDTLQKNCLEFGVKIFGLDDKRQGIVHVMGPEQGLTLPGMTIVCGDSHTSTHGALGSIAMGIGTSDVEHVLVTQTLVQRKLKNMRVNFHGQLPQHIFSKDIILALIGKIGTAGGTGYAMEFTGSVVKSLGMEARMTVCNMSIEAGSRVGLIAVDDVTVNYIKGRPFAPSGSMWDKAEKYWRTLVSDQDAIYDKEVDLDVSNLSPQVTWGTSPEMVCSINSTIPDPDKETNPVKRKSIEKALKYMSLKPNMPISEIPLDRVFIGSCTNSRIEDLRIAASYIKGAKVAKNIKQALIVPGSGLVKKQAEAEGLHEIFMQAGFEWREPGCSMCLAMNADRLEKGEHCASTSNRNFEGRQGVGSCTHLVSPATAALAAIHGRFTDITRG